MIVIVALPPACLTVLTGGNAIGAPNTLIEFSEWREWPANSAEAACLSAEPTSRLYVLLFVSFFARRDDSCGSVNVGRASTPAAGLQTRRFEGQFDIVDNLQVDC